MNGERASLTEKPFSIVEGISASHYHNSAKVRADNDAGIEVTFGHWICFYVIPLCAGIQFQTQVQRTWSSNERIAPK